ncbi:MAG: hypothetical protein WCR51_11980 [Planctomycetia bacterium]
MFETIAMWVVLVLFAFGTWLTVGAIWGMAADSSARRAMRLRSHVVRPAAAPARRGDGRPCGRDTKSSRF